MPRPKTVGHDAFRVPNSCRSDAGGDLVPQPSPLDLRPTIVRALTMSPRAEAFGSHQPLIQLREKKQTNTT
jgi:hypothetical protein